MELEGIALFVRRVLRGIARRGVGQNPGFDAYAATRDVIAD